MRPIDALTDKAVTRLNNTYKWRTFVVDRKGRRIGNPSGRRHDIPHPHVLLCDQILGLKGKSIVELGCHEGTHTVTLAERGRSVVAIDFRQENLDKTRTRCEIFGVRPELKLMNVDKETPPGADLLFHIGVLYHLQDPVIHLTKVARVFREIFLDTHHAPRVTEEYTSSDGNVYPAFRIKEDVTGCASGAAAFSRWLPLQSIVNLLSPHYKTVRVLKDEPQRNGPRATIIATNLR